VVKYKYKEVKGAISIMNDFTPTQIQSIFIILALAFIGYRLFFKKPTPNPLRPRSGWEEYIWNGRTMVRKATGREHAHQFFTGTPLPYNYQYEICPWEREPWERFIWCDDFVVRRATPEEETYQKENRAHVDSLVTPGMMPWET
jgi:hypothetical protein